MTKKSKNTDKNDIICKSCGNEYSSEKVKIPHCPFCKQASLEIKVIETKVVN